MMKSPLMAMLPLLLAAPALGQSADAPASKMKPSEIAAHNVGKQPADAEFISCRRTEVTGSLVKKLRVCRTTAEWAAVSDSGNRNAREYVEQVGRAGTAGN